MTDFPSLKGELAPRPRLKRSEPSEIADAEVEANSRTVGQRWGASTALNGSPPQAVKQTPVVSIRGYIPVYLDEELAVRAAERRVTKTFLIMEALNKFGYRIEEGDLIEDRRKRFKATR